MVDFRRRRRCRGRGPMAAVFLVGFVVWLGIADLAGARGEADRTASVIAQPYHPGPLETRDLVATPRLPRGAEELLGLSVLAGFLYGLRASGLGA